MPSKKIEDYELVKTFESFAAMKKWIKAEHNQNENEENNTHKRHEKTFNIKHNRKQQDKYTKT